ncbi:MAG: accessory gene regulator ArgB-like protein [Lachnospiraceae bacterium]
MIKKCQSAIVDWLIKQDAIREDDRELYEYALYSSLLLISPVLLSVTVAYVMGNAFSGIVTILPFMTIRKYSGGFHSDRIEKCILESVILVSITIWMSLNLDFGWWTIISIIIAEMWLCIFSPIDSASKKLSPTENKSYRKIVLIQIVFYDIAIIILCLFRMPGYALCLSLGIIFSAVMQVPCILKMLFKS